MMTITGGVSGFADYDRFLSKLGELRNPHDLEYLGSLFPKRRHPDYCQAEDDDTPCIPFIHDDDYLTNIHSNFGPFWYDAAIALGLAACDASDMNPQEQQNDDESVTRPHPLAFNGKEHFERFKYTQFRGVTGNVAFYNDTGSRDPSSALYKVVNYVDEDLFDPETGTTRVTFRPILSYLFLDSSWQQIDEYRFNDGTTNLPDDLPPPENLEEDDSLLESELMYGLVAAGAMFMGVVVFIFCSRRRKEHDAVFLVNPDELTWDDPPEVIGRGSFGYVLLAEYRGTKVSVGDGALWSLVDISSASQTS